MKNIKNIILVLLPVLLGSCGDILEEDLREKQVKLYAPSDSLKSPLYTINFWWEEIHGASAYRLQIVQVDSLFSDSLGLIIDTTTTKTQYQETLSPGAYQWSVIAVNGAYTSLRSEVRKVIVDSVNISGQTISMVSPEKPLVYTNKSDYSVKWKALPEAEEYEITYKNPGVDTSTVKTVSGTTTDLKLDKEGKYTMSVIAIAGTKRSNPTQEYTIIYDTTAPEVVDLVSPGVDSASTQQGMDIEVLTWEEVTDGSSGLKHYTVVIKGGTTDIKREVKTTSLPITDSMLQPNTNYHWYVQAVDNAGNVSVISEKLYFKTKI